MNEKKYNVGIDLGTTNSVLCVYNELYSRPDVLKMYDGNGIIPSVVYFNKENNEFIIGSKAKEQADFYADSFCFMKTRMSLGDEKIEEHCGVKLSPIDFSSEILKYMYKGFKEHYGEDAEIENLVITVPAYFKDKERKCTLEAASRAGIKASNEIRLINEPTAATLAYGDELKGANKIVTYDLGGGTFDVTLLEIDEVEGVKIFEAKKTDGKTIGGYNFDQLIIDCLIQNLKKETKKEFSSEELRLISNSLKYEAEKIKISLSNVKVAKGTCIAYGSFERYLIDYNLTKEDFEKMIEPMIDETIEMAKSIIGDEEIDYFVLVGGSTRIPFIEAKLRDEFGSINIVKADPDLVVASGAAIQAGIISKKKDSILNEILSGGSIGVSVKGDFVSYLVREGTPIPFTTSERYNTSVSGTSKVETYVVQGKDINLESPDNAIIGKIVLENLVVSESSSAIDIKVTVDKSGAVEIAANEVARGGSTAVKLFKIGTKENVNTSYLDLSPSKKLFKDYDEDQIIEEGEKTLKIIEEKLPEMYDEEAKNWFIAAFDEAILLRDTEKIKELIFRFTIWISE
ncbi:MAG: Hsp70 family protein [Bacillales bacterium]|nr:Hsp70 family protein [Bacillales bacterium]